MDKHKQNMKILYWGYMVIIIIMAIIMLYSFVNMFLYMGGITYTGDLGNGTTIEITPLELLLASSFGMILINIGTIIFGILLFCTPIYGIIYLFRYKESSVLKTNKNKFEVIKYLIIADLVMIMLAGITKLDGFAVINLIISIILMFMLKSYIKGLN